MGIIGALYERGRCRSQQEIPRGRRPWNLTLRGWPVLSRSEGRGCSAGALSFAKGGVLTFAYRLEFFANSLTSAQSQRRSVNSRCSSSRSCLPPFFITITCATHHRHITRPSATMEIDLWQVRGVPVNQDSPQSCPSPASRRSLKTQFGTISRRHPAVENSGEAKNELSHWFWNTLL